MGSDSSKVLNALAINAANDEEVFERLLEQYRPFILSQVKKAGGKGFIDEHDDLASIGLIAFQEAVSTYNEEKGNFLVFAGTVIRCRVIDQVRKGIKNPKDMISIDDDVVEFNADRNGSTLDREVFSKYYEQTLIEQRQMEIEIFNAELLEWGITLRDVYKDAPKHKSKREEIWRVVRKVLSDKDILKVVLVKKYLPIQNLAEDLKIHRKKIEKSRRYIIACVVIARGDYPMLKEYLRL